MPIGLGMCAGAFRKRRTDSETFKLSQTHSVSELEEKVRHHDDMASAFIILATLGALPLASTIGFEVYELINWISNNKDLAVYSGLALGFGYEATMMGLVKHHSNKYGMYDDAAHLKKGTK